jgi:nitrogen fixation/metabolism regulation signal transduction histidine kinase
MATRATVIRWAAGLLVALTVLALAVAGLYLASDATVGRARLGPYYPALLTLAGVLATGLGLVIALQLLRLWRALRARAPGARLNGRLFMLFAALSLPPALLVFGFALNFLFGAVDSRFAAPVAAALDDALEVGRLYLEERREGAERAVGELAQTLARTDRSIWLYEMDQAIEALGALQLAAFAADGAVLASSSADPDWLRPETPPESLRLRLAARDVVGAVEQAGDQLVLRALARIDGLSIGITGGADLLQAVFPVPARYAPLAGRIEAAAAEHQQLEFLRDALKLSMAIILGLVLLLVVLASLLLALRASRRLVMPVARLADATAAVARGEFGRSLPPPDGDDELGDLILAFNDMTGQLAAAQASVRDNQALIEAQRAYLDAVLARISSAVIGLDRDGLVRLVNPAAERLLALGAATAVGRTLDALVHERADLAPVAQRVGERARAGAGAWSEEVRLEGGEGAQVLLLRGSPLLEPDGGRGHLVVFDDATVLNRAQREAAWAEVARRLAHEIKNPLTPIQLAAERLRRRYLGRLPPDDADVLERATGTIVTQVESLKSLVNAFADYARPAPVRRVRIGLNALVADVLELYGQDPRLHLERRLADAEVLVRADPDRLRQVLHNLIKNAIEAMAGAGGMRLTVATASLQRDGAPMAVIEVRDHGPGLPAGFDLAAVEPYRSDKPRGSGLGLVIVQRIVEEHGGRLEAENAPGGGARFRLWLPA